MAVAALVLANVALAFSQFAEPLLFGKVIDSVAAHRRATRVMGRNRSVARPWAGFGLFIIVAGVTVA